MMGRTHALTGWCAGLGVAQFVGATSIEQAVLFAVTTSGFALLPDLDHPHARASKLLGPISRVVSWLLRHASAAIYAVTKGPRDERKKGTHRHLSHTVLFAVGLGFAASVGTEAGGPYAVAGVAVLGLLLAQDALGDWMIIVSAAAVVWWLNQAGPDPLADLGELSGLMGIAVAVGCITHCLGDAITESGASKCGIGLAGRIPAPKLLPGQVGWLADRPTPGRLLSKPPAPPPWVELAM